MNGASLMQGPNGLISPGSLISIFATGLGTTQADADSVPFSTALGGVSVTINGIPAPVRDVVPAGQLMNVQVPFEVLGGLPSASVNIVVTVGTQVSQVQPVNVVPQVPGVFTIPPGGGNAFLLNLEDGSMAAPTGSNLGYITNPISRGSFAVFYATGLGQMTPAVADGDGAEDGILHVVTFMPQITIGGIAAPVLFAGQAPGFPGMYQVNIQIPENAPTGSSVPVQVTSADGTQISPASATIAIQ
jgi:uncharacterized protein (TIGR03437 family)